MSTNVTLDVMRLSAGVVSALIVAFTMAAHAEVYRCTESGKVTYTDAPCAKDKPTHEQPERPDARVPTSNSVAKSAVPAPADFYGEWHGQARYQATVKSAPVEAAHAVVDLIVTIDPKGKLTGESNANGCRALGMASPGFGGQTLQLDVTFSGCRYAGFNRRFTGTFGLPLGKAYATVSLLAYAVGLGMPSAMYDIKATMRR